MRKQTAKGTIEITKGDRRDTFTARLDGKIIVDSEAPVGCVVKGRPDVIMVLGGKIGLVRGELDEMGAMWTDVEHMEKMEGVEKHLERVERALSI